MPKHSLLFFLLFLLGAPAMAQNPNRDSLLAIVRLHPDDSAKVSAYHMLSALAAGTDPAASIVYGKQGAAVGQKIGHVRGTASCFFNVCYSYGNSGNPKAALLYVDSAITWYKVSGKPNLLAMCYNKKADLEMQLGHLKSALDDCTVAYGYAQQYKGGSAEGTAYGTMAAVYALQGQYDLSITYYEKAYDIIAKVSDSITMAAVSNKLGNVYQQKGEYIHAIQSFEKALRIAQNVKYENDIAAYYTNLSNAWLKSGDKKKAAANAEKAVNYARLKNNKLQLAAAQTALSNSYLQTDSTAQAIRAGEESFALAEGEDATAAKKNSADVLAEAYAKQGDYKMAYHYLGISQKLNDSIDKEKYGGELAGMQAKFQVNEKDKAILLMGKDRQLQGEKIKQQRLLIIGAVTLALLALMGIWLLVNRNKLKQRMKELELRNQIAADLHDEVGSSLSSIHMLSQMAEQPGSGGKDILSRMSNNARETMEKMSDIVWMIKPGETEAGNLKQRIARFGYEICSSKNIALQLNIDELESARLTMEQRKNIYLIFKEALNNAVKYSGTSVITVTANVNKKELVMLVKDEGSGFDTAIAKNGNGLDNIRHRAESLHAKLGITTAAGEGTTVRLVIPMQNN